MTYFGIPLSYRREAAVEIVLKLMIELGLAKKRDRASKTASFLKNVHKCSFKLKRSKCHSTQVSSIDYD